MTDSAGTFRRTHWEGVYNTKAPGEVSWFQERPDVSLELIIATELPKEAAIADVGGGASTLVDHLLARGFESITVLDISEAALDHSRARLGKDAERVAWVVADVTRWHPKQSVDLWHDRAVLHFLTAPEHQRTYAGVLRAAVKAGGWVIIGGFAPDGPQKCSGLDIVQHDAYSLNRLLGEEFRLVDCRDETHHTPWNSEQAFRYHLFRRG